MPFPRLPDLYLSLVLTSIIMLFIFWRTMVSRQQAVAGLKSQKPDTRTYSGQLSPTFSRFSAKTYPNSNSNWEISMQTETCRDILDSVCWAYREPLKIFWQYSRTSSLELPDPTFNVSVPTALLSPAWLQLIIQGNSNKIYHNSSTKRGI